MAFHSFFFLLSILFNFTVAQYRIKFGPFYSLGATKSYIVESETTLYPGEAPSPQQDRVALWPGMGTENNGRRADLVQSIVLSVANPTRECGGKPGQWCAFASQFTGAAQRSGKSSPMSAGQGVKIIYKYIEARGEWSQEMMLDGKPISSITIKAGKAKGWGTAVECQDRCMGKINAHSYQNTTIKLAAADPAFGKTLRKNQANAGELTTADGGLTWKVGKIDILQCTFTS